MAKNYFTLISLIFILGLGACGKSDLVQHYPNTGDHDYELMLGSISNRASLVIGKKYFVSTSVLNVRSSDEIPANPKENIIGRVFLNEEIVVVAIEGLRSDFVAVKIKESRQEFAQDEVYYVSFKYLNDKKVEYNSDYSGKYFVVQNLATEKIRVYERACKDNSCPHKMVFETEMVVGEQTKKESTMTSVGSFYIIKWEKFYQDYLKRYPRWWDDSFPEPPRAGVGALKWTRKRYMPNGQGNVRGAFGWFTAIIGYKVGRGIRKDPSGQWTHGTIGWGVDKKKYIKKTKRFWANVFADPRSHGCTRVDNESIAYLRQILPEGTPLIKIYAKEAYQSEPNLTERYSGELQTWDYILTKEKRGVIGRSHVLNRNIQNDSILEEGSYEVDMYPDVVEYTPGEELGSLERKTQQTGNVYGIHSKEMHGVFYIDTGKTNHYRHPRGLRVGGNPSEVVPSFMKL